MANVYRVEHETDLTDMEEAWAPWRRRLQLDQVNIYERLARPEYAAAHVPLTLSLLARQIGLSQSAFYKHVEILIAEDLLDEAEDEGVITLTVKYPPFLEGADSAAQDTDEAESREKSAKIAAKQSREAEALVHSWAFRCRESTGERYKVLAVDVMAAQAIVKQNPNRDLRTVIRFYWERETEGEKPRSFVEFCNNFDTISDEKSDYDKGLI